MNPFLLASVLSGFFFAVNGVIYKAANRYAFRDPLRLLFFIFILQLPVSLLVFPFAKIDFPADQWPLFTLNTLVYFLASLLTALAIVRLDVSVFMPLFNLQVVFTSFFAFLFLGERFTVAAYLLMFLIVLGGFLVSADEKLKLRLDRPLFTILVGLVLFSLSDGLSGRLSREFGALNLRFWMNGGLVALSLGLIPFFKIKEEISLGKLTVVFGAGFFGFAALVFFTLGFSYSLVISQVFARLSSVYSLVLIIILSRFRGEFLEKHTAKVYWMRSLGSFVMVGASIVLVLIR